MIRTCHIYTITHSKSGKSYVGSAVNPHLRWIKHRSLLNAGNHHCEHLQRAWTKYGEAAFLFAIVETLPNASPAERLAAERAWIARIGIFNTLRVTGDLNHFTASPEAKRKISATLLARIANDPAERERLQRRGRELAALLRSTEGRARAGRATARRWENPEERPKLLQGLINRWCDPKARTRHAEAMRELRSKPEERKLQSDALKAAWADPTKGLQTRQSRWDKPGAREQQAAKMRAYHASRRADKP